MFRMELPEKAQTALETLRLNGYCGYVVGGCVRDACMGKTPHDFDLTTDAKPLEILRCFAAFKTIETGMQHGTVTVVIDHEPFEITTFRVDGDYRDNRHPSTVTFTDQLTEDLARRDLTVNAMAYDGETLVDPFGGQADIQRRLICCVGDPDRRFREDGLRILRAMRFAAVLGFDMEKRTGDALRRNKMLLRNISAERLYAELRKLVLGQTAQTILTDYADVFRVFLPGYSEAGAAVFRETPPDLWTRLSLLCTADDLRMLHADKKTIQAVAQLQKEPLTDALHLLHRMDAEQAHRRVDRAVALQEIDGENAKQLHTGISEAVAGQACVHLGDLAVRGSDLQKRGLSGVRIGETLDLLLEQVLTGTLPNNRAALLEWLEREGAQS